MAKTAVMWLPRELIFPCGTAPLILRQTMNSARPRADWEGWLHERAEKRRLEAEEKERAIAEARAAEEKAAAAEAAEKARLEAKAVAEKAAAAAAAEKKKAAEKRARASTGLPSSGRGARKSAKLSKSSRRRSTTPLRKAKTIGHEVPQYRFAQTTLLLSCPLCAKEPITDPGVDGDGGEPARHDAARPAQRRSAVACFDCLLRQPNPPQPISRLQRCNFDGDETAAAGLCGVVDGFSSPSDTRGGGSSARKWMRSVDGGLDTTISRGMVSGGMLLGGPNPGWAMSARSDGECDDEDDSPSATSAIDKLLEAAARGSATDAMSGAAAAAAAGVSTPAQDGGGGRAGGDDDDEDEDEDEDDVVTDTESDSGRHRLAIQSVVSTLVEV